MSFQKNRFCVAFVLICLLASAAWPQVSTSRIEGTVVDSTSAVIADATVRVTNEDTGVSFQVKTSSIGTYSIPSLTPGTYTVSVTRQGFETSSSTHNVLSVGAPLVVNVTLKVGATTEVVEVQGAYQRIETTNAAVSDVMTPQQVKELPLNGRNPLSLLTLEPGVTQRTTQSVGSGTHVFGSRDRSHNVTIDGIDANESTVPNPQSNIQRLNPDNVQEFRTVTLDPTAEFGRNSGANVMVATKPGSNGFHGDLFYFNRNTAFNANEWFNNANGQPRPDLKLNQYGFDVGGPILKKKTFFFGTFQNNDIRQTGPISSSFGIPLVYTASARSGIFRYVVGNINGFTSASRKLVDANGNLLPGVPVCFGAVTTNCVASYNIFANDPAGIGGDPAVMAMINSTPVPNTFSSVGDGLNTAGFAWNPPTKFTGPNYMVRVDHTFSENDSVFARYLQNHFDTTEGDFLNARPEVFPGFPPLGEVRRIGKNLAVQYRHVFSPNLVNEFTTGFNRFAFNFTFGESNPNFGNPAKLPPWSDSCVFGSFINISAPNCVSPHTQRAVTAPQFIDNLSWVHGAHTIRTGINFRSYYHNDSRGFFGSGILAPVVFFNQSLRQGQFNNIPATCPPPPAAQPPGCMASSDKTSLQQSIVELAGIPAGIQQGFQADFTGNTYNQGLYATVYTRAKQYDMYVQDEWHLRPNLTLNAGVRWEINPPPSDAKQTLVPDRPVDGSQGPVSFVKADSWYKNSNLGSLGPRVGIAWSPDQKTAVRAGYGWLFDTISTFQITSIAGKIPGFILNCTNGFNATGTLLTTAAGCNAPTGTTNRISQGFPTSVPVPFTTPSAALSPPAQPFGAAPSIGAFDPNLKNPSVHEWDLTIQRELPGHFVAEIGYVGKRGTHLYRAYDLNQINVNQPNFLASFLTAQQNVFNGCRPDGSGCPAGVTGTTPNLLMALTASTSGDPKSFVNSTTSINNFKLNSIGNLAQRIDQLAGPGGVGFITTMGFAANFFRPNPQFSQIFFFDSGGDSYYHGGFVAIRRRFEQGLDLGFTYTLSKSIDDMSVDPVGAATGGGLSTTNSRTPTDVHNFRLDRARSDFDDRHVIVANLVYELPFGHGKTWGSHWSGLINHILGGWGTTGIFNYQSGEPYTLYTGNFTSNNTHTSSVLVVGPMDQGHLQSLPGVVGPSMYNTGPLITNPADPHFDCRNVIGTQTFFCIPPPGQIGSGRNLAQGPNFWNLDAGLSKNVKMTERFNLQLRAEFFNILNHANFENPRNATSGSPAIATSTRSNDNFGLTCCTTAALASSANVNALGEPMRVLQFGVKVNF
jgi:Carboxypeptidase regulatory-like domain/TonB dependent receptor